MVEWASHRAGKLSVEIKTCEEIPGLLEENKWAMIYFGQVSGDPFYDIFHEWIADSSSGRTKFFHHSGKDCADELFIIKKFPTFVISRNYKNYGIEIFKYEMDDRANR